MIHQYGPHLFHTTNQKVFHYLSQFTDWVNYHHEVLAVVDGQKIPLPFNLNSLAMLFPKSLAESLEKKLIERYGFGVKVPILELRKEDDKELKYLADFIYDKVFANYTAKQWGCKPEEISEEVTARVPIYISRDNRYFQDNYQAIPKQGYTKLFENMLQHPNISLMLNTNFEDVVKLNLETKAMTLLGQEFTGKLIYTGMIDQLFNYHFGELPYRSLRFQFEHLNQQWFQETTTVNYPNDYDYTRITEFKHISQQDISSTSIVKEFPQQYNRNDVTKNIPYYPVFTDENTQRFKQYQNLAAEFSHIILVGRLAEYRYYNMDNIVERALAVFQENFVNSI